MSRLRAWWEARSPRQILGTALGVFWIYCWPGFVGWDTREHMLQARSGVYTDAHPPAVALLQRLCELFVAGPLLMMLIQSIALLGGLFLVLRARLAPRRAAVVAAAIFLFPLVAGVTGLIAKDSLMAGFLMIGIALLLDPRPGRRWLALGFVLLASLMRWNAVAATFAPMVLLFRWRPGIAGVRRYAVAVAMWLAIAVAAYGINEALTDQREYYWYWSHAYEDIAGTLEYVGPTDDATLKTWLAGVPLLAERDLSARLHALYDPAQFYQLVRDEGHIFGKPVSDAQRAAVAQAWRRIVFGHPAAYLRYRVDSFRRVLSIDGYATFSNVYVWLSVIAAPETIAELEHDAAPSRLQEKLIAAQIWISLTRVYAIYVYFALCFVLLPWCLRRRLAGAILLSAIGYELQWFFLAPTPDIRYSQWMVLCSLVGLALIAMRGSQPDAGLPAREPAQ